MSEYLKKDDRCQVATNHRAHGSKKGRVWGVNEHCPPGTSEIMTKVIIRDDENGELFDADFDSVLKIDTNGKPVPYVKMKEQKKIKNIVFGSKTKKKSKSSYKDRIIEWGEWLRLDLEDGSTLIRSHSSSNEMWANSGLVAKLTKEANLKEMHPKHRGWVVRPLNSTQDDFIFVGSLEEAEGLILPFRTGHTLDEESVDGTYHENAI
jgi:hypothetical protein